MGLRDLLRTYNNASYPFFQLKDRVVELYQQAYSKGFTTPLYSDLEIVHDDDGYNTTIRFFYDSQNEGKAQKFEKKEFYGELEDIPDFINNVLESEGKVQIKIKNYLNLLAAKDLSVQKVISFDDLGKVAEKFKLANRIDALQTSVKIIDELFYTRVVFTFTQSNGQPRRVQSAFRGIAKYPTDVWDALLNSEDSSVIINL